MITNETLPRRWPLWHLHWVEMLACRPLRNRLIVDHEIGLGKVTVEALKQPEFLRRLSGVVGATSAPQIENAARAVQTSDVCDNAWHRNALRTNRADQRVIDIDKDDSRSHESDL